MTSGERSEVDGFDTNWRFVRIVERRPDGFVEFQFAVGDPEIYVEMIMAPEAFAEFCAANAVTMLDPVRPDHAGDSEWTWDLHDATHQRFKS